jgi:hypothetical protein
VVWIHGSTSEPRPELVSSKVHERDRQDGRPASRSHDYAQTEAPRDPSNTIELRLATTNAKELTSYCCECSKEETPIPGSGRARGRRRSWQRKGIEGGRRRPWKTRRMSSRVTRGTGRGGNTERQAWGPKKCEGSRTGFQPSGRVSSDPKLSRPSPTSFLKIVHGFDYLF